MAKVLVVDDDRDILDMVELLLSTKQYTVQSVFNGDEVTQITKTFLPDVILLDVNLGGHDGRIICKQLKTDLISKHIPVILFSATPGLANTYPECEASDFLAKPFDADELFEKIEKHMN